MSTTTTVGRVGTGTGDRVADWHELRVAYAGDRARLITEAVGPALAAIAPRVARSYHQPHWRQGPHVRVAVDCPAPVWRHDVGPELTRRLQDYLTTHPGPVAEASPARLAEHRELAATEVDDGPLLPWLPPDAVVPADHEDRAAVLGSAAAQDLIEDCYSAATASVLALTAADPRRRTAQAYDLLVATAASAAQGGLRHGFLAFRSHAEAYLCATADGPRLRPRWDRRYDADAAALSGRAATLADRVQRGGPLPGPVADWLAVLTDLTPRVAELVAAGAITLGGTGADTDRGPLAAVAERSPFHADLTTQDWWREFSASQAFGRYRVIVNLTYLHLTRALITPVERFGLCHLVARAAEDAYGRPATELLHAARHEGGRG